MKFYIKSPRHKNDSVVSMSEQLHPQMISDSGNTILSANQYLSAYSILEIVLNEEDIATSKVEWLFVKITECYVFWLLWKVWHNRSEMEFCGSRGTPTWEPLILWDWTCILVLASVDGIIMYKIKFWCLNKQFVLPQIISTSAETDGFCDVAICMRG